MYPLHKNETGSFQELAHKSDVEFGQLSMLTVAPGCERGWHYHTRKREWFCCTHGSCLLTAVDVRTGEKREVVMQGNSREFVLVEPYESHTVENTTEYGCELLVICSEEYDPDNADTIKYKAKGEPVA
jgi:UDP-2-acetamido-2,6-beta-L-arabino-hexul-4-ose reductase